ncbi:MAG: hypothetical protein ACOC5K_03815 [Chloroflexota bacterium]
MVNGDAGYIGPGSLVPVELGEPITAEDAATDPAVLLEQFRIACSREDCDWHGALVDTMALWPLAEEKAGDRRYVYLIGGEAFDWRALAARILTAENLPIPEDEKEELLLSPGLPGGLSEDGFRRRLGFHKSSGFLNYFYGVTVEQALFLAVEEEIRKKRYAGGRAPNDAGSELAYEILYGATRDELSRSFESETGQPIRRRPQGETERAQGTSATVDHFTYWLFKVRFKKSDPARIASDTRKGLEQLERMRLAYHRLNKTARRTSPFIDLTRDSYLQPIREDPGRGRRGRAGRRRSAVGR